MSRIKTMARFEEPEETDACANCESCGDILCYGDSVHKLDGSHFCSIECVIDWVGIEEVVLNDEEFNREG